MRTLTLLVIVGWLWGIAGAEEAGAPDSEMGEVAGDVALAARYAGDLGIGDDPAVIYASGFEDGIQTPLKRALTSASSSWAWDWSNSPAPITRKQ